MDAARLEKALQAVQRRHVALRQVFSLLNGDVFAKETSQVIHLHCESLVDLSEQAQRRYILAESKRSFNLNTDISLRASLFTLNDDETVLLLVAHHASFDFWSLSLVMKELAVLYPAFRTENSLHDIMNGLPQPMQFPDCARKLIQAKSEEKYRQAQQAVVKNLQNAPALLNLSTDFPPPAENGYDGCSYSFSVPRTLTSRIYDAAKTHNVTTYMLLLSVFQVLLHRYTGQNDILVGSPVAGREKRKYREVVGNFVNTIVLRSQINETTTFAEHLQQAFEQVVSAVRHQSVQFPQLVKTLIPKHDANRSPLIQAYFAWDKLPQMADFAHFFSKNDCEEPASWGELTLKPYWLPQQEGQFDIALEMGAEIGGELTATLKYREDMLQESSIAGLVRSFVQLLNHCCEAPEQSIASAALLNSQQAGQLLRLAESSITIAPPADTVHALVQRQATLAPNAIAVEDEKGRLSYRELDRHSNQIARYLRQTHTVQGQRVGVCLRRNTALIATLLGIMKADASYVPIDPILPTARARMIIEDAELSVLITDETLPPLEYGLGVPTLSVQQLFASINPLVDDSQEMATDGTRTAYIMFTSGSTGRPKGVPVPHDSVVNLLCSFGRYPGFSADDKLLAVTTMSFDISVLELFLPLTHGGTTVVLDSKSAALPDALMSRIEQFQPTVMQATPATWKMLFDAGWQGHSTLRVLCGGEALPKSLANRLLATCGEVYNVYGPTETTIWSTIAKYTGGQVTIGAPIANTQTYVLDAQRQLVPRGVVGELYIAGKGLSYGYYNKPELTSAVFVDNPYGAGLMYRTGDLARLTGGGELECLGRIGNQVKIRGFRIELDDIEENIRAISGVRDAVVVAREINQEATLICFYTVEHNDSIEDRGTTPLLIKNHLKTCLPHYMVPTFYSQLENIPLNSSGKVDRRQLPDIELAKSESDIIAPRNALERQLLEAWQQTLKQPTICVSDDFFDIGGHSLLAVQLISNINQALGLALGNQFALSHTTIAAMAAAIKQGIEPSESGYTVVLNKGITGNTPLFLMHPIGGTVYCYRALSQYLDDHLPIYAFQSPGIEDAEESEVGIEEIVAKYVKQIVDIQAEGPYVLGGWCFGGVLAYEAAHQLQQMGHDVAGIYVFDTRAPIVANHPSDGDDATLLSWFARDLAVPYNKVLDIPAEELRQIDPDEQFAYVLEKAKVIGVVEENADADKLHNYFQVYVANGIALQMYEEKTVPVPVTLYLAADEPEDYGPLLGWDGLAIKALDTVTVPGTHNSIMYKPWVANVASDLNARLLAFNRSQPASDITEECIA